MKMNTCFPYETIDNNRLEIHTPKIGKKHFCKRMSVFVIRRLKNNLNVSKCIGN